MKEFIFTRTDTRRRLQLRTLRLLVLFLLSWTVGAAVTRPEQSSSAPEDVRPLLPGDRVNRRMDAGATHSYQFTLASQQFAQVLVDQRGVDVGLKVFAPGGSLIGEMDSPNGFYGRETISIVSQAAGDYRVDVYSYKGLPPGDYDLKFEHPRIASEQDQRYITAERSFVEAQKLRSEARGLQGEAANQKLQAAITKYNEALDDWTKLNELRGQGYALTGIGRSYKARGQLAPALDHLHRAIARLRSAGDMSGEAFALNEMGAAHRDLGDQRDALSCYEPALKLRLTLGDRYGQAQLYNNIGLASSNIGYQPQAVENLEKARPIWRDLGMRHDEMNTLINAAKAHVEMGDLEKALSQYEEVLAYCNAELSRENSPLKDSATFLRPFALNGIGLVHETWSNPNEAFNYYQQALELFRSNKNLRGEADVLDNLGMAHAFLSDPARALDYLRQALVIRERMNDPWGWGHTLSNIGYAHTLSREHKEALQQLEFALALSRRARDRRFEAYTLLHMGMAHLELTDPNKALESYEKALAIQQEPGFEDRRGQAMTLHKIGEALARSGQTTQAIEKYGHAIERWRAVGDGQGEALSLYGIAKVERDRHNLANARDRAEEAIRIVEKLRNRVTARQLQMIYFAGKQDLYALAIDVRMRLYELTKSHADVQAAFAISERARARNLLDLLSEARTERYKGMSAEDTKTYALLESEISGLTQTLLRLRSLGAKVNATKVEERLADRIRQQDNLLDKVRRSRTAATPQPLAPNQIQQLLDDKTILLQYSLGDSRSHLWVVTRTRLDHYFLKSRGDIEKAARQLRETLTAYEPKRADESTEKFRERLKLREQDHINAVAMSQMVLGQVWNQLNDKRLIIVADGVLQYIPFDALPPPHSTSTPDEALHTLLSRNEIVYEPSASALAQLRATSQRSTSKTVAVLADPVFDKNDERIPSGLRGRDSGSKEKLARSLRDIGDTGDESFTLSKLVYSATEAHSIIKVAPKGSTIMDGFKANRSAATDPNLKHFGIVHFATHGILNDKHPELSGIVLSMINERGQPDDGYLTLRDIYNLDLPVSLVVVSACNTGIGQSVRGEGLIGLTRGFMYAGAQSVVVSLWRVDDQATAELMRHFYTQININKLSPAAALRRAKLEMMEGHERWRAPYYWAGFVIQGDWK